MSLDPAEDWVNGCYSVEFGIALKPALEWQECSC